MLLDLEVHRRGDHGGVDASAEQSRGASADVATGGNPLHVARLQAGLGDQAVGVVIGRIAHLAHADPLALEILNALDVLGRHEGEQALLERTPQDDQRSVFVGGRHGLFQRVGRHHGFAADHHRDAGGMNREDQVRVEPVLLVVAAFFGDVERPDLAGAGGVVDGDLLELLGAPASWAARRSQTTMRRSIRYINYYTYVSTSGRSPWRCRCPLRIDSRARNRPGSS